MILTTEQKHAVTSEADKIVVVASAGSGKTSTLCERIKYLISNGTEPDHIFAITYTNMAAQEMQERIENNEVVIGTIHSIANQILIMNGIDTRDAIKKEDFDYLLQMINEHDEHLNYPKIDYLLVDEFQDVTANEFSFIFDNLKPQKFFIVGDSCQSIYGFKGANFQFFTELIKNRETTVFELKNNFRNTREIIRFSIPFVDGMEDVHMIYPVAKNEKTGYIEKVNYSLEKIAGYIEIRQDYKDWFVLARSNRQVEIIMNYLKECGIPCSTFKKADKSYAELKETLNEDTVKVLTIHSAKGLESKKVIVVGAQKWNNEERRISYVAATRAKEQLIWMKAKPKRKINKQAWAETEVVEW